MPQKMSRNAIQIYWTLKGSSFLVWRLGKFSNALKRKLFVVRNNSKSNYAFNTFFCLVGDGRKGYSPAAPYDAIHVGAAAPVLPEEVICVKLKLKIFTFFSISF